jgi:hypothetical protein
MKSPAYQGFPDIVPPLLSSAWSWTCLSSLRSSTLPCLCSYFAISIQESLADTLHVKQASISKMERRSDMYISTLSKIIEAMGGELQIIANMPNGRVQIRQFTKIRKGEFESVQTKGRT